MAPYADDEPVPALPPQPSGPKLPTFAEGKVTVEVTNQTELPLEQCDLKVMVTLTGAGSAADRPGLDIVTVLDVSGSMFGEKIDGLKTAMRFLINKLSPSVDRLSIVAFSDKPDRRCELRLITPQSVPQLEDIAKGLNADGNTNIAGGLETALQVIAGRRVTDGRKAVIMLMTDGYQNIGNALAVPVDTVPVYTFGFGNEYDAKLIQEIAAKSAGGTFSMAAAGASVQSSLSVAFSQILGGIVTTCVEELTVTAKPLKFKDLVPTITEVSSGKYLQKGPDADGSKSVVLGDLCIKETRTVLITLSLPAVAARVSTRVLQINYFYKSSKGGTARGPPNSITVVRTKNPAASPPEKIVAEEKRLETAEKMKGARELADKENLADARKELVDAKGKLDAVVLNEEALAAAMEMLGMEVETLRGLMSDKNVYAQQGRAFALASELSHATQRFAARGDVEKLRLFATPRMGEYLKQAVAFEKDPSKPPPTAEEDANQEAIADPLAPFAGAMNLYLGQAIDALKALQEVINAGRA